MAVFVEIHAGTLKLQDTRQRRRWRHAERHPGNGGEEVRPRSVIFSVTPADKGVIAALGIDIFTASPAEVSTLAILRRVGIP